MTTKRLIELHFDDFGRSQLRAVAERHGLTNEELLARAARECLSRRASHGFSRWVPRFRRVFRVGGGRFRPRGLSVSLELQDEEWRDLEAEAERQGVTVERLVEHAAVQLLSDLESDSASRDD
jgi:predicted DNA-binding ribbon-helix-helix protein